MTHYTGQDPTECEKAADSGQNIHYFLLPRTATEIK